MDDIFVPVLYGFIVVEELHGFGVEEGFVCISEGILFLFLDSQQIYI